jgi:hypothetical protein
MTLRSDQFGTAFHDRGASMLPGLSRGRSIVERWGAVLLSARSVIRLGSDYRSGFDAACSMLAPLPQGSKSVLICYCPEC